MSSKCANNAALKFKRYEVMVHTWCRGKAGTERESRRPKNNCDVTQASKQASRDVMSFFTGVASKM